MLLPRTVLALALFAAAPRAQSDAPALARALTEDVIAAAGLPGLSVAVALDGKLVFAEAFGLADLAQKTPATAATRYRTASVCKLVTVTALAKLVEAGRVELDGSIHEHVVFDPPNGEEITFRQLSTHTAGVEHYSAKDRGDVMKRHHSTVTESLEVFAHKPLVSSPGAAYRYSTHGYTLLGAALEGAGERDFLTLCAEELFGPLGMTGTGPDLRPALQIDGPQPQGPQTDVATLYDLRPDGPRAVAAPEDPSYKWPAGGLVSTPSDLVRLGRAYLEGFVPVELVEEWWRPQALADGRVLDVGIGWRLSSDRDGRRVLEHAGSMEGARSVLCVYPEHGLVIALMTNASWRARIELTARLFALPFLVAPAAAPVPEQEAPTGEFALTGEADGKPIGGTLALAGAHGTLTLADGRVLRLRQLRGEDWALFDEGGGLWLELAPSAEGLEGRAFSMEPGTAALRPSNAPSHLFSAVRAAPK
jgi:CubicO group peptidase (beta-lactamase class C family)